MRFSAGKPFSTVHSWGLRIMNGSLLLDELVNLCTSTARGSLTRADTAEGVELRNSMHNRVKADVFVPAGGRPNTIHAGLRGNLVSSVKRSEKGRSWGCPFSVVQLKREREHEPCCLTNAFCCTPSPNISQKAFLEGALKCNRRLGSVTLGPSP